ncbi:hypothetical protein TSUD_153860 [Trifolium subterraneum]|uniref:MULE transposase domain-containing protein n=1 Tax=Trifolium subterraneum TaxID=3900 RepID=A0A2Z6MZ12_TRISU|nr:hypothetical protein TSUD_153860 [Trifolium subterraneum]
MEHGDVGYLLQYFQKKLVENPTFYHAYKMDDEDQITNVFWVDASMLIDYECFGDVISLDSTYCTNTSHRPLAVFSGFNHHRKAVIFGAALLYEETTESYKWLLETFLEAHKQKMPQTVFTDQAQAMAKALGEVMPGSYHDLCVVPAVFSYHDSFSSSSSVTSLNRAKAVKKRCGGGAIEKWCGREVVVRRR